MKTKAVIFPEVDKYEFTDIELGEMGSEDILVRTLFTAISPGTERWTLRGKHAGVRFPCIPGYHRIGIVEDCGKDVTQLKSGDIVYGSANRLNSNVISMFGAHISHSVSRPDPYMFLSDKMLTEFEFETLSFLILVSIAQRGIETLNMHKGNKMLMIGSGIIGITGAQLAQMHGVETVLLDIDSEMIKFVNRTFPGQKIISPLDNDWLDQLKVIAPQGFNYLYDTVGHAETTNDLIGIMKQRGEIMLQAQYFDREKQAINLDMLKLKELTAKTTCGSNIFAIRKTINHIMNRNLKIAPLITHRFKVDDALKAYRILDKNSEFNLGMVFDWR